MASAGSGSPLPLVRLFVQARMSSARFPGKVLAPLGGKPIINHIFTRINYHFHDLPFCILTSTEKSDDPLAAYLKSEGVDILRGPLNPVVARFKMALQKFPCTYFIRICADSPFFSEESLKKAIDLVSQDSTLDVVTTTFPRSFPRGNNIEVIKSETFLNLDEKSLTDDEKEHITLHFYDHPNNFKIHNILNPDGDHSQESVSIDTIDDLKRLEKLLA